MPECDSQDFAEETRRLATSAPRFCARVPMTKRGDSSQGSAMDPAGKIGGAGNVEKGRQQRLVAQFAGVYQLGHGKQSNRGHLSRIAAGRRVGQRAIGGSEIDSDYVLFGQGTQR